MKSTHLSPADALTRLPGPAGERFVALFRQGSLEVELYAPRGRDAQTPHRRDEVYVVVSGRGVLVVEDDRNEVGPGSVVSVDHGADHHFADITEDLTLLVVFAPPEKPQA